MKKNFKRYFPIISVAIFVLVIGVFVFQFIYHKPYYVSGVISEDLISIYNALKKIDTECDILNIANNDVTIDFLTVEKFIGSQVGGLNLAHPERWKGPYLKEDPTLFGIYYRLLKSKDGYFIVPGNGAKLPNGYKIGKDFNLNKNSFISKIMDKEGQLNYKGYKFAKKLEFKIGDWKKRPKISKAPLTEKQIEQVNSTLKEFNEAMPFTYNYETSSNNFNA
ncbi:hypothetical protein K9L05_01870 [Candidatus Babeliales bacterium]|nr:hypothetical protein [Candidatus Babeliales bacterium]